MRGSGERLNATALELRGDLTVFGAAYAARSVDRAGQSAGNRR